MCDIYLIKNEELRERDATRDIPTYPHGPCVTLTHMIHAVYYIISLTDCVTREVKLSHSGYVWLYALLYGLLTVYLHGT